MPAGDEPFDLVCVGSGLGGLAAAVTGARSGLRTVLIEGSESIGGTSAWSQGIVWVGNNHLEPGMGVADPVEDVRAYLDYVGGGRIDPAMRDTFIEQAPAALRFFCEEVGLPFYVSPVLPDHYYPVGVGSKVAGRNLTLQPFPARSVGAWEDRLERTPFGHGWATFEEMAAWGGRGGYRHWDKELLRRRQAEDVRTSGMAVVGHFFRAALDAGVEVRTGCRALRLRLDGTGRVVGLDVESEAGTATLSASNGIVLATGMYDASPRLMGWFDEFNVWPPQAAPRNQGQGFVMAAEIGAAFAVAHGNLLLQLGYVVPGETVDGQPFTRRAGPRELTYPHSIIVNRFGRRFADESTFGDVAAKLRHFDAFAHRLVNVPAFFIFDAQYLEKYGLPPVEPGSAPPGWLPRAETPRDLATLLGIDPDGLDDTLARFNRSVETSGGDAEFQRGRMVWSRSAAGDRSTANANLAPLVKPPFFGLELLPVGGNAVGLVTDRDARVVHLRGHPIPGLYACGDVTAQLHVGVGYQAGLVLAGAMTFGWLAAQHAARTSLR